MQDGRFSTIRFNEWICVSAQYEKAVARLGRQVYQGFSQGYLTDFGSLEICKEISDTFAEAREIRLEIEEELERDALDGLNVEEAKKADEIRKLTQTQKSARQIKLKITKFLGMQSINRSVAAHRDKVRDLSRDLGLRAMARYREEPVLKKRGHKALCRLAEQLCEDADKKWDEIVVLNKQSGGGLSFHTILINFVGNFANFSKGTATGKFLLKFFKYDESQEKEKLSRQYEGSQSEAALRAQMEEVEEPHLNVGREIDTMQQEYEETPEEWLGTASDRAEALEPAAKPLAPIEKVQAAPVQERWEPQADTWNPESKSDDDFLEAAAAATELAPQDPPPTPPSSGPTLLRKRPEPEAESWLSEAQKESPQPIESTALPTVGSRLEPELETPKPVTEAATEDDWGWESTEPDPWETPESGEQAATLTAPLGASLQRVPPPQDVPDSHSSDQSGASGVLSQPTGKRPPFIKTQDETELEVPAQHAAVDTWESEVLSTELPASKTVPDPTQENVVSEPTDWESFEIPLPPEATTVPLAADFPLPQTPRVADNKEESDPLLLLLRMDQDEEQADSFDDDMSLDDDLLPDFLKNRSDEEQGVDDGNFIPELPSFLADDDGPPLDIVPFGSASEEKERKLRPEEGTGLPFIPDPPE